MSNVENFLWTEAYRPQKIEDCILPKELKKTFADMIASGDMQNMLFSGGPGCGKTTVAKILCKEMNCDWLFINASESGNIDTLRTTIRNFASTVSLSGGKKVVILDEAEHLNCFSGDQKIKILENGKMILENLQNLENRTVSLQSYDFSKKELITTEGYVFKSGEEEVFEVEFDDGTTMQCTKDHPFFTENGEISKLENLEIFTLE